MEVTLKILANNQEFSGPKITLTVVQAEFKVTIQAFIPYLWVDVPGSWMPWWIPGSPTDEIAIGDNRHFDSTLLSTRYRSRQEFIVTPFADLYFAAIKPNSNLGFSSRSIHYKKSESVPSIDQDRSHGYFFVENPVEVRSGEGTFTPPFIGYQNRFSNTKISFTASMSAWEGVLGQALSAPINWNFEFGFDVSNLIEYKIIFAGQRSGFPAYEVYIEDSERRNAPIYQWMPPEDRTALSLLITEQIEQPITIFIK